jgi:hypothetical protein
MLIMLPCSFGELIDKLTILEIKRHKLKDAAALNHVEFEWQQLNAIRQANKPAQADEAWLEDLQAQLKQVNLRLWDLEDCVRSLERAQDFGPLFVSSARAIYSGNDLRARIKLSINTKLGSKIVEVKSHVQIEPQSVSTGPAQTCT